MNRSESHLSDLERIGRRMGEQPGHGIYTPPDRWPFRTRLAFCAAVAFGAWLMFAVIGAAFFHWR